MGFAKSSTHLRAEPCVYVRENVGEASVGGAYRPASEPRTNSNPDADVVHWTKDETDGARDRECPDDPASLRANDHETSESEEFSLGGAN